jgi:hypothetical protein
MYFGTLQNSIKFACDGPIKDAHHKKTEIELWVFPQLINEIFFW